MYTYTLQIQILNLSVTLLLYCLTPCLTHTHTHLFIIHIFSCIIISIFIHKITMDDAILPFHSQDKYIHYKYNM